MLVRSARSAYSFTWLTFKQPLPCWTTHTYHSVDILCIKRSLPHSSYLHCCWQISIWKSNRCPQRVMARFSISADIILVKLNTSAIKIIYHWLWLSAVKETFTGMQLECFAVLVDIRLSNVHIYSYEWIYTALHIQSEVKFSATSWHTFLWVSTCRFLISCKLRNRQQHLQKQHIKRIQWRSARIYAVYHNI